MPYIVHNTMGGEHVFLSRDGRVNTTDVEAARQFDDFNEAVHMAAVMNLTSEGLWEVETVPYGTSSLERA